MTAAEPLLGTRRIAGGGGRSLLVDGEPYLNFAGCNYLALGERPELRDAARRAIDDGALFSRYLVRDYGGFDEPFERVEAAAAAFYGTETAAYLPSGYLIGAAGFAGLRPDYDVLVLDEMAHWCLADAATLSDAPVKTFRHGDVADLERVLDELAGQRPLIVSDGVFATTGELPPLDHYYALAEARDGCLFIDESHAAGVVGPRARGAVDHFGLGPRAHVGTTLSKGLCGQGSVFVGSEQQVARARATRALRGSSPGSPISALVSAAALDLVRETPDLAASLRNKASALRARLRALGLQVPETPAAIAAFAEGDFAHMRGLQAALFAEDIYVLHSNYIAAGPGGMIRLSVFADHAEGDFERVCDVIARWREANPA
ncbi:MAG: pyridoxal phosphate-dependent aminotransferase family protein [Haliea sp.]|uniref:aminotransferase class I/II-fold pyridoxal phosphate-dependent enzyme n=1 Tax=Haliea sp. TaxID=1932666 RepID=UPI0032EACFCB